ncbi:MAG: hypothetical protein ACKVVT_09135 [Dehalococcoidia bacterium]
MPTRRDAVTLIRAAESVAEGFALAWLPERWWAPAVRARIAWPARLRGRERPPVAVTRELDSWPGLTIAEKRWADRRLEHLPSLRAYRPGGWRPPIDAAGLEHLDNALREGRGAVLWVPMFHCSTWVAKDALHRRGYQVSHLSNAGHGLGQGWPYKRWFNRLRTRQEERNLRERVTFSGSPVNAVRAIRKRLDHGGLVSITLRQSATTVVTLPFYDRTFSVPLGPIRIAAGARAPLLALMAVRKPDGRYAVTVEPDLLTAPGGSRRSPEEAAAALVALLTDYCSRYPGQLGGLFNPEALLQREPPP